MLDSKKMEWDLSLLGSGNSDPKFIKERKTIESKSKKFVTKWKKRTDYLKNPNILLKALDEYQELISHYSAGGNEHFYFWLKSMQDQNDPQIKAKYNQIDEHAKKIGNDLQFFPLRVARIPKKIQSKFLKHKGLSKYHYYLFNSFESAKYLLSEEEEKIMTLKSKSAYEQWVEMVSGLLSKEECSVLDSEGKKNKVTFNELRKLVEDENKSVRDSAALAFNEVLYKWRDVAEQEINAVLSDKRVNDSLRKFKRPDSSRLIEDDIDEKTVDALISSVSDRFDIPKKYYSLKAKLLGLPKLAYHERNVPYGKLNKTYSYEQASNLVFDTFKELDEEFSLIFKDFVEGGHIDVKPTKGKWGGAFCVHHRIDQPTYILLNYLGNIEDVLTIAHESGHGINNELMRKKQHALYFDTPKSTAEVASTFMEDFVLQKLLKDADEEERLAILVKRMNDNISTIFRQVACYRFEQELHSQFNKTGYLSHEDIGKIFQKHMISYMGDSVEQSPGSENWWMYWSHIREFFYVYSYASGLLISKSMQNSVKKDPKFISKVKEFLSTGTSKSPKKIFLNMGIDITSKQFWNNGLKEIEELLIETESLAKKLGKI